MDAPFAPGLWTTNGSDGHPCLRADPSLPSYSDARATQIVWPQRFSRIVYAWPSRQIKTHQKSHCESMGINKEPPLSSFNHPFNAPALADFLCLLKACDYEI